MGKKAREKRERKMRGEERPQAKKRNEQVSLLVEVVRFATYLILLTPLITNKNYFFPFVGPKGLYFMALAQVIFFSWLLLAIYNPNYRPKLNFVGISLGLFLIVFILSGFFGEDILRSFWSKYERMGGILMWLHLFGFFLAISNTFKKKSDWLNVFIVSVFTALLVSFISILIKMDYNVLGALTEASRSGSTLGNTSFMGTYLLFNFFLALYLVFKTRGWWRVFFITSMPIMFYSLVLSGRARAAMYSILIGLGLMALLYLAFERKEGYYKILARIALVAMLIGFLIFGFYLFQPGSFAYDWFVRGATYARLVVWQGGWQAFLDKPILGWGPENFELSFTKYFNPCMFLSECGGEIWFDRAHNIVVDTLVMNGALGMIAYLGIFASVFYVLWQGYFKRFKNLPENEDSKEKERAVDFWAAGVFSVVLIAYFIQNLTVFDMVTSYLMFFLVLGFVAYLAGFKKEEEKPVFASVKNSGVTFVLILFTVSFFFFVFQPMRGNKEATVALNTEHPRERMLVSERALRRSPMGIYQIREAFANNFLSFAEGERAGQTSALDIKMEFDFLIEELEQEMKASPLDFKIALNLAKLYNYYTRFDPEKINLAEAYSRRAIELSPTNQQGYWELAQTRLYQGNLEEAFALAQEAVNLEPRVPISHLYLVQVVNFMDEPELLEETIQNAVEIDAMWEAELRSFLEPAIQPEFDIDFEDIEADIDFEDIETDIDFDIDFEDIEAEVEFEEEDIIDVEL